MNVIGCRSLLLAPIVFFAAIFLTECSSSQPGIHSSTIEAQLRSASESHEWLTYGHDLGNQRFSPLRQITVRNVTQLRPAYVIQTGVINGSFETSPIAADGVLYLSQPYDGVIAVDAESGDDLWRRPPITGRFKLCCGPVNRGVAITDSLVIFGQVDGVLVALDRATGATKWTTLVGNNADGYSITMAPIVSDTSVIVGVAGSEFGIRGSVSAFSTTDGTLKWRWFVTDPKHWFGTSSRLRDGHGILDAPGSARARKRYADSWKRGGGGIWASPALDRDSNTLFVATGNPWPDEDGDSRPGDNLFTDCIVALDASNGFLKWYYQETKHDTEDLDAASPPILFDTVDEQRRVVPAVGQVGKTGIFYILDRRSGRVIRKSPNLATISTEFRHQRWKGGTTWSPPSFDKNLGYVILTAAQHLHGETGSAGRSSGQSLHDAGWQTGYGTVTAIDVKTGKPVWQDQFDEGLVGGTASTASGITFVGEGNGYFDALETATGRRLWRFQTGAGVNAPPVVFESRGREYVAVASGGNSQFGTPSGDAVITFSLPQ